MSLNPSIRASDADRERVAGLLRDNLAEGRLTLEEFDERLSAAYSAKTYGELDRLLVDLPLPGGLAPPTLSQVGSELMDRWDSRRANKMRRRWSRFVTVNALCWAIWGVILLTPGAHGGEGLWPLWVTLPWGALMMARGTFPPTRQARHERSRAGGARGAL